MFNWIDTGVLAGMSIVLCYWLIIGSIGMGVLTWRYRARFWLSLHYHGDAILTLGLFGYMAHGAVHRGIAAYNFAVQNWPLSTTTVFLTGPNLIEALASVACILWWMCIEMFGPMYYYIWWMRFILSGVALGICVSWIY